MKLLLPLYLFSLSTFSLFGQQLPLFTHSQDQHGYINPANFNILDYNGTLQSKTIISGSATHQMQLGIPKVYRINSTLVNFEGFHRPKNSRVGLLGGIVLVRDEVIPYESVGAHLRLAGYIGRPEQSIIGFGGSLGRNRNRICITKLNAINEYQLPESIPPNCQTIDRGDNWDVNIGMFASLKINQKDNLYFGVSLPQLNEALTEYPKTNYTYQRTRHLFAKVGYLVRFNNFINFIDFTTTRRSVGNISDIDFKTRVQFGESITARLGIGYSIRHMFQIEVAVFLDTSNNVKVVVSHRLPLGETRGEYNIPYLQNGGEITVGYAISKD